MGDRRAREMYVELLKRGLLGDLVPELPLRELRPRSLPQKAFVEINRLIGVVPAKRDTSDPVERQKGQLHPAHVSAMSMIGRARMDNVHECALTVLKEDIPGDFIETGVWRGGTAIFMRGLLAAYDDGHRKVWVADSFQGVPPPSPDKYPVDAGYVFHEWEALTVTKEQVRANFERYGLLDARVEFLEGWFKDTLPGLTTTWSLIRLDGDLYESTIDAISALYPMLSPGGFILIDDYQIEGCKSAIADYRTRHEITEPIQTVDWTGAYWRRERRTVLCVSAIGRGASVCAPKLIVHRISEAAAQRAAP